MTEEFPDTATINAFNNSIADEFRANDGKVAGPFADSDLLLLTTTGAKSGQSRLSPLAYFRIDGKLIIVGSFAGAPQNPAWVHNLRSDPRAHIEVGAEAYDVTARETSRVIPLFELQRT
jgi:deazaflavin-dependent oxidoreductase (nitroreductase family)